MCLHVFKNNVYQDRKENFSRKTKNSKNNDGKNFLVPPLFVGSSIFLGKISVDF